MSLIVAIIAALSGVIFNNVWVAIGGLIVALFLQSTEIKWLHHHMHHMEEDHTDGN